MSSPTFLNHLKIASILVLSFLGIGTAGYMLLEGLSFIDALYTTVAMMTTVGVVIHPLTEPGRIFTIFVILFGVGTLLYTLGAGVEFMIEGHFSRTVRRYLMDSRIAALRGHAIICGFGRVGSQIAEDFAAAQRSFVVIDADEDNVQLCAALHYLAILGDATNDDMLREAGIQRARDVLIATDNDAHNISTTLSARYLNHDLYIVARANHSETEAKLKLAGADQVLSPYTIGGHRMANLSLRTEGTEVVDE